jgi:hypothetical protein
LRQQLEVRSAARKSGMLSEGRRYHADDRDSLKIMAFGQHLCADENIGAPPAVPNVS